MPCTSKGLLVISKSYAGLIDHHGIGREPLRLRIWAAITGQCAPVWLGDNRRVPSSVISRTPTSNVKYDHTHPRTTESRLRTPSKNIRCTAPHSHHAGAPVSVSRPKSATALLRPIVAKLPWCR